MRSAQRNKKDKFYTLLEDIQKELTLYKNQFKDKVVLLPCDSSESNFFEFLVSVQNDWKIKKIIAVCYNPELFGKAEIFTYVDNVINQETAPDNGDILTSSTIRKFISECDIIATNPPFSLFREFMKIVFDSGKQFIILGNMNQILTKDILPYVVSNQVWFGPSIYSGDRLFMVPDDYPLNASGTFINKNGQKFIRVKGVRWFTNVRPDEKTKSRAIVPDVKLRDISYERFDYIDAICINRTQDIPSDYNGLIGVPLTYFDRHNQELFEIIDGVNRYLVFDKLNLNETAIKNHWHLLTVNGKVKYFRFLIRRKS